LIEWTGERCVPWTPDVQVAYEHLHRYLWAAKVVAGRRVLDLGSGEGFGSSILADRASEVVGLDIDERTVEHAQLNWSTPDVSFVLGSALDLSAFEDGSFDAVVAFEVIEHLEEQEQMLSEVGRVLSKDGVLIVSTPDRRMYSEATGQNNPFHRRELTYEEFSSLLEGSFGQVAVWGQHAITGSHLGALDRPGPGANSRHEDFFIERAGDEWRLAGEPVGLYLVALASNSQLPEAPTDSTLGDCGLELVHVKEWEGQRLASSIATERDEALERERAAAGAIDTEHLARQVELKRHMDELAKRDGELAQRDEYVEHRQQEIVATRARLRDAETSLGHLHNQLVDAQRLTRRVEASVTWQLFQRTRGRLFSVIGGESSPLARILSFSLRLGGRLTSRRDAPPAPALEVQDSEPIGEPINLPVFEKPTASLIIPLYSRAELTRRALETIRDNTEQVGYEVILIDDTADAETKQLLELVKGARVLSNDRNYGYLRSVNRGATMARGRWLVLCNNDIEVTSGWLSALIDCAEETASTGVVAPKFVAPDGSLSEAGSILWSDGTGVNYGRGQAPSGYQYEYRRQIDYGSAAALLVSAQLWQDVEGFDQRYEPMYYEDADLCFEARSRGWRVLYEPAAVVVHAEGSTAGTDPKSGHKRFQEVNRRKFVEKWRSVLEEDHLRPGAERTYIAANRRHGQHVLIIDYRMPMWDRDAGSLRMFEMIRSLLRQGCGITFLPDNFAPIQPYTRELQRLGVEVVYGPVDMTAKLAEIGPNLSAVILSRPHTASRWLDSVREVAPSAVTIYDTVDLHWVRETRRFALGRTELAEGNGTIPPQGPKAAALRELELAMVRASDVTVTVTDEERAQIVSHVPDARVMVIPTIHEIAKHVAPAKGRRGVLFVGGFEHPPNVDAVTYLVREVMPLVWARMPQTPVTLAGSGAPQQVRELAGSRVDVAGWVADLTPLLDSARVMAAPVRFGAGVKGKVTQGLAAGLPVVTTPVGAEGLDAQDNVQMLIGEDAEAIAERIMRVIEDDALWQSLSRGGQELVAERCSLEILDQRLSEALSPSETQSPASAGCL
jgi:GT2 family glycosyltransferase/SAM-dependent methyltransferase